MPDPAIDRGLWDGDCVYAVNNPEGQVYWFVNRYWGRRISKTKSI